MIWMDKTRFDVLDGGECYWIGGNVTGWVLDG